jgi:integrase
METHNKSAEDHLSSLEQQFPDTSTDVLRPLAEKQASNEEVTFEEALEMRWQPKNENAVRTIPFDFDVRVQLTIERFCDKYDVFPKSKATINRRIKRVVEESEISKRVYPHSLRATAATLHAARDVSPYSLMSVMGWSTMDTARSYIASSNETAAKELRGTYR